MFIPLILLCFAGFINSKAIPEELQKQEGKQKSELPEGWETGGLLYNPRTDGRPIYIPPILKSDNAMKDLLDDYYKPTHSRTLSTTVKSLIDRKEIKEDEYEEPILHPSNNKKVSLSNTRLKSTKFPNVVTINIKQKKEDSKDKNPEDELIEKYEEPILKHSFKKPVSENKKTNFPKGDTKSIFQPVEGDGYDAPDIVNKVNKKQKDKPAGSLLPTENIHDYDEPVIQHASKKQVTNKKITGSNTKVSKVKVDDFEVPVVINSVKVQKPRGSVNGKQESKNLETAKTESESKDEYEEPLLRQSSKKSLGDKNKDFGKQVIKYKQQTEQGDFDAPITLNKIRKNNINLKGTSTEMVKKYDDKEKLVALASNKVILQKPGGKKPAIPETTAGEYDVPIVRETSKSMNKKRKPIRIRFQRVRFTSERPTSRSSAKRIKNKTAE